MMGDDIPDEYIREITELFIDIANAGGVVDEILSQYAGDKSLAVEIIGSNVSTGFIIQDGAIRIISDVDNPALTMTMPKHVYWNILQSDSADEAQMKIYSAVFAERTIRLTPSVGTERGLLNFENVAKLFRIASELVYGG